MDYLTFRMVNMVQMTIQMYITHFVLVLLYEIETEDALSFCLPLTLPSANDITALYTSYGEQYIVMFPI